MMTWWWLSFVSESTVPDGDRFLGVLLVQASSPDEAARVATALGCCPDGEGEVMYLAVPPSVGAPPTGYENRLLQMEDLEKMVAIWMPGTPVVRLKDIRARIGDEEDN